MPLKVICAKTKASAAPAPVKKPEKAPPLTPYPLPTEAEAGYMGRCVPKAGEEACALTWKESRAVYGKMGKTVTFRDADGGILMGKVMGATDEALEISLAVPNDSGLLCVTGTKRMVPFADVDNDALDVLEDDGPVVSFKAVSPLKNPNVTFKTIKDSDGRIVDYQDVVFTGHASTFEAKTALDRQGDVIVAGSFSKTLKAFQKNPVMLIDHKNSIHEIAGSFTKMGQDGDGLLVEGALSNAPGLQDIRFKVVEGHIRAMSIGGVFFYDKTGKKINEVELFEISIVAIPANQDALFTTRALNSEECVKLLQRSEKFNRNHANDGRFGSGGGTGSTGHIQAPDRGGPSGGGGGGGKPPAKPPTGGGGGGEGGGGGPTGPFGGGHAASWKPGELKGKSEVDIASFGQPPGKGNPYLDAVAHQADTHRQGFPSHDMGPAKGPYAGKKGDGSGRAEEGVVPRFGQPGFRTPSDAAGQKQFKADFAAAQANGIKLGIPAKLLQDPYQIPPNLTPAVIEAGGMRKGEGWPRYGQPTNGKWRPTDNWSMEERIKHADHAHVAEIYKKHNLVPNAVPEPWMYPANNLPQPKGWQPKPENVNIPRLSKAKLTGDGTGTDGYLKTGGKLDIANGVRSVAADRFVRRGELPNKLATVAETHFAKNASANELIWAMTNAGRNELNLVSALTARFPKEAAAWNRQFE